MTMIDGDETLLPDEPAAPETAEHVGDETGSFDDDPGNPDGGPGPETDSEDLPGDDDFEEIDYEGRSYRVPRELKDAFLRQADYTRKTQDVSEQRRALEQDRTAFFGQVEAQSALRDEYLRLTSFDNEIQTYDALSDADWQALQDEDPVGFSNHRTRYLELKQARSETEADILHKEAERTRIAQHEAATRAEVNWTACCNRIPGWNEQKHAEITAYLIDAGGQPETVHALQDPLAFEIAEKAHRFDQLLSKQKQAAEADKPSVQPTRRVTRGKGGSPGGRLNDRLSTEDWMKQRQAALQTQ